MAFNLQTFKTRTLTAVVFVALMLGGLLWNQWSFLALFSLIHFGCWWEYLKLTEKIHRVSFHIYTKLGLMVAGYGLVLWCCQPFLFHVDRYALKYNLSLPVSAAGFALLMIGIFQKNVIRPQSFAMALGGIIYLSLPVGMLIDLTGEVTNPHTGVLSFSHHNMVLPCLIIFSLWINDTMAYIVGSFMGKTPLSKVSPKKTWEGTAGGIILATAIGYIIPAFIYGDTWLTPMTGMLTAFASSVAGTLGDLFESKLKRMADVKDSGTLMPGHGGFLDRFDSLLFAVPVAWFLLKPCLFGPC